MPKKDQTLGLLPRKKRGRKTEVSYTTKGFGKPDDSGIMKNFDTVTSMERQIVKSKGRSKTTMKTVKRDLQHGTVTKSKVKGSRFPGRGVKQKSRTGRTAKLSRKSRRGMQSPPRRSKRGVK